ncbi:hypothetical protein N7532_011456 [Penicillium argentinense]|uniref:25S rRNA (Uridine(2843)-N(3))-methyltransferase n=1 Tax=Penicillium argentinense TaxID=1131581 RepID=A0A9W9EIE8_9EURO|nr:uncharacterized protein N7532_011456 [Penicillium argentinense]KAJ5082413.1 hypothetical protein N7532_011456 [Penicillium argentinense]
MPSLKQGDRKMASKPKPQRTRQTAKQPISKPSNKDEQSPIDFTATIPLSIQQLLLDVFRTALLPAHPTPTSEDATTTASANLDTKTLIQTIKSHLYQRDFDSAFTEAGEDLLRAYALRWSAARALGYAGLFKAVLRWMREPEFSSDDQDAQRTRMNTRTRVVCIGGGAGAEIAALAAAWRSLDFGIEAVETLKEQIAGVSLDEKEVEAGTLAEKSPQAVSSQLSVAAIDIADWSSVVSRLEKGIASSAVPAPKSSPYQPPLVPADLESGGFSVSFQRADVLGVSESDLKDVLLEPGSTPAESPSLLVTLMFTLNELFSTSMAKTTGLLLRITELLPPKAVLLVVDSPGSYSTLKMGKGKDGAPQERKYPMKFLLDHTLLSVAEKKWERVYTQDSRWWRRDAARLRYDVGEGAGLEDMRFQVHVYRRL